MSALDLPRVRTGDAAYASGLAPAVLQQWLDRGLVTLSPLDKASSGSGDNRLLTIRRVTQIAIVTALNDHGVPVRVAAGMARRYTDEGNVGRQPGELYPTGSTFLVQDTPSAARVVNELPVPFPMVAIAADIGEIVAYTAARLRSRGIDIDAAA